MMLLGAPAYRHHIQYGAIGACRRKAILLYAVKANTCSTRAILHVSLS